MTPIAITPKEIFSAVISDEIKYLKTNSGPQIMMF